MKIYESWKDIANDARHFYCRDLNVKIDVYTDSVQIIDLTNAMKAGKECTKYTLISKRYNDHYDRGWGMLHHLLANGDWKTICEKAFRKECPIDEIEEVAVMPKKGVWTFSPFVKLNTKGKPTAANFPKLVLSGKIAKATCRYSLTDDYYDDAKRTFERGKEADPLDLAEEIVSEHYQNWMFDGKTLWTDHRAYEIEMN